LWGKENVNNEDKIDKRDVVFYKANPHSISSFHNTAAFAL